ncbi:4-hydroxy-3-methylbut-2-enyl diphosphate reductase [Limnobacter sp.]|jgi:4-hydroxy-3-methylbut-2-enyl diphosphate reductase|uniref:4-hydroxy-3-methylbut-2-enyl diphosphate reductase n=1 Tax=Limnobacter sp. TaxID=2003368 RepID=UPI0025B7CED8|nr:4-hydroxy-3-methylbut-2-enyl diphosphate reductase [Limnobacter sp.]
MEISLAQPRGFCAGVDRAIEIVERALQQFGSPIYVKHEIVHNKTVVEDLRGKGAIFVDELEDVPTGSTVVFSAHGVSQDVRTQAESLGLKVFDATCPLVTKVHVEVSKMRAQGCEIIMIGHEGHPEVEGTMGQVKDGIYLVETEEDVAKLNIAAGTQLAFVTQTTLSVDDASRVIAALKSKFPEIREPKKADICYATQNRQDAVKFMARQVDLVLVVGSPSSSNSNRLREVAEKLGVPAKLIENADSLERAWFDSVKHIGLTAGASAPEHLVQGVVKRLKEWGALSVRNMEGVEENIAFPMPKGLNPRV